MFTHTYYNFRDAVLHSLDYRCSDGHLIHELFSTIFYNDIVWC